MGEYMGKTPKRNDINLSLRGSFLLIALMCLTLACGNTPSLSTPLTAIHMLNGTQGWGLTSNTVLKTEDGGKSWLDVTPPDFRVVESQGMFMDQNTAWVVGQTEQHQFTVQHTSDGGAHWQGTQFSDGTTGTALLVGPPHFVNQEEGWLDVQRSYTMGTGTTTTDIFHTIDGGNHWNKLATFEQIHQNASFYGKDTGISVKDKQNIWETVDPVESQATGEILHAPIAYVTHDGGNTWQQQTLPPLAGLADATYTTTPPVFFGEFGLMPVKVIPTIAGDTVLSCYRTNDGGSHWSSSTKTTFDPENVYIADQQHIWVASRDGSIHESQDGGKSWKTLGSIGKVTAAMSFSDMSNGWIVTVANANGKGSQLLHTTDGGQTWQQLN
jgi:photosystem II stability/assembly factor-like uncharacterized protein